MTTIELKLLLRRHIGKLLLIPIATAIAIFFFLNRKANIYTSNSTIFTGIASTYRITGDNNEGYKQLRLEMAISDLLIIINSRETKKEVALSLLAQHLMLNGYNPAILSNYNYDRLKAIIPDTVRNQLRGATFDETLDRVTRYSNATNKNEVHQLIHSSDPIYSIAALSNITSHQLKGSEIVYLEYSSTDPAVSQQTLKFLDDIFIRKQNSLFATQTASVIGYFDTSVQKAHARLQAAEQRLLAFNKANNILDYDQQVSSSTAGKQNAAQRYNDLELQYSGALSSLKTLENDLKKRGVSNLGSQEIIRLRNQLSDITNQITNLEALGNKSDAATTDKITRLKSNAADISGKIKEAIDAYYTNTHSSQGVPVKDLIDEFVQNMLATEQLKSQLDVLRRQNINLSGEYNKLVPLGSEIRRIKREIEVAQQDYLAQIEGLKQSMLTQENQELSSSQVKVLDPPDFPGGASNKAKLPLLLVAGFLGSLLLIASLIIAAYLLDKTLKTPAIATQITGMPVLGVLPDLQVNGNKKRQAMTERAAELLSHQVLLQFNQPQKIQKPFLVGILSTHSGEGKSFISQSITRQLNGWGVKTKLFLSDEHHTSVKDNHVTSYYDPLDALSPGSIIPQLETAGIAGVDIMVIEFPPVLEQNYPVSLLRQLDLALIVIRSDRTWQKSDKLVMEGISKLLKASPRMVLTGVAIAYVKEYTGFQKTIVPELFQQDRKQESRSEMNVVYNS